MAITKVTEGARTLGTGEVTTANMATDPTNASNLSSGDVPLAQLGNAPSTDVTGLQDDIALLGFKVATNGSLGKYNLVDQTEDSFQDATGVDTSASTNELRNSASNYYVGSTTTTVTVSGNYDDSGTDGDYSWYKWTTVTAAGTYTTDVAQDYEYLIIAGGGGGGTDVGSYAGGGGGAGGYRTAENFTVAATTISSITVGAGGATDTDGDDSVFSTITSTAGGGGGTKNDDGNAGGSGGGGGAIADGGAASPAGQGYAGGSGVYGGNSSGGGGGGASQVGYDADAASNWAKGGNGLSSSIDSIAVLRGGGAGGGHSESTSATSDTSSGGTGGGGNGGDRYTGTAASVGTVNTGGGGGGGYYNTSSGSQSGAAGGSGIVIIRRLTSEVPGGNLTLVANSTTAEAVPTKGDMVMTYTDGAGTATLNTDLKGYVSRDDGTTYTQGTLASQGTTGGHTIVTFHDLDISSQPAGSAMLYKIETLNQSAGSKETRIQAVSLGWS